MILTKRVQNIYDMMAATLNLFLNFCWCRFLIIRQNVNTATNAIMECGLSSITETARPSLHRVERLL